MLKPTPTFLLGQNCQWKLFRMWEFNCIWRECSETLKKKWRRKWNDRRIHFGATMEGTRKGSEIPVPNEILRRAIEDKSCLPAWWWNALSLRWLIASISILLKIIAPLTSCVRVKVHWVFFLPRGFFQWHKQLVRAQDWFARQVMSPVNRQARTGYLYPSVHLVAKEF